MAYGSAFSISGWDPVMSYFEGNMGQHFLKQSARTQFKYAKKYAEWSALNGPSLTRQGLVDAGYNPLLALSGSHEMPTFTSTGSPPATSTGVSGGDPLVFSAMATQRAQRDLLKAQTEKVKAETGALSPSQAIVSLFNTPQAKEMWNGLMTRIFSSDGPSNNAEMPPIPNIMERFSAWNKQQDNWLNFGLKEAKRAAGELGLDGKERERYIERARRRWNARHTMWSVPPQKH